MVYLVDNIRTNSDLRNIISTTLVYISEPKFKTLNIQLQNKD